MRSVALGRIALYIFFEASVPEECLESEMMRRLMVPSAFDFKMHAYLLKFG